MGHNKKTASRADAIKRNSDRFRELSRKVSDIGAIVRRNDSDQTRERLILERELLDQIGDVLEIATITAGSLEYHLLPWYRRTFDWIKVKLGFDASEDFDEVIDLDFSEDKPDHLDGRPLDLDYKPIEANIGQEADGLAGAEGEDEPVEADAIFAGVDNAKPDSDISGVYFVPSEEEPNLDELRPIRIAAAVELDADPNNLDPELGTPIRIAPPDEEKFTYIVDEETGEKIELSDLQKMLGSAKETLESGLAALEAETRDEIEEAGAAIEEAGKYNPKDELFDNAEILRRMELREEAEREIATSIMENRVLLDAERERLMDQSITRIERIQGQIAHHKLVMAGFSNVDATEYLDARPPIRIHADDLDDDLDPPGEWNKVPSDY